jgi:hypothetical protein
MTSLAPGNARNQNIARFGAADRFRMATYASETGVRRVIELRVRQPPQPYVRRRDRWNWNHFHTLFGQMHLPT